MGRELKRVPLDFDYPLDKIWEGYLNPYYKLARKCPDCDGSGESPEAKRLSDMWYGYVPFKPEDNGSIPYTPEYPVVRNFAIKNIVMSTCGGLGHEGIMQGIESYWKMYKEGTIDAFLKDRPWLEWDIQREAQRLCNHFNGSWSHHLNEADVKALLDDERLSDFTKYPRTEEQKVEYEAVEAWNEEERQRCIAADWKDEPNWRTFHNGYTPTPQEVNDWSISGIGHGAINQWICVKARLKRERIRTIKCRTCKGEGELWPNPEDKRKCSRWRETKPPKGEGFQLWTTTSEGAPISPVFSTLESLCEWCADNATTFGSHKATKEQWMKMLDDNFVYHQEGQNIFM